mgnify:CR=1 FL=1
MGKKHSVNKEKSYFARKRHRIGVYKQAQMKKANMMWKAFFRLFWTGDIKTFNEVSRMLYGGRKH